MQKTTIAAIATAPGKAGISVIRLSGKEAHHIAEKVFLPKNKQKSILGAKGYTALFGTFVFGKSKIDQGIALVFCAPHSYTGENVVEFSCHGGSAVTESLLQSCFAAGAQPAAAGEFTLRAVVNGRISLTQAEAVMDIIEAEGKTAMILAKTAMDGALFKKIDEIKDNLLALAAHLAAWTDYPEEDVDPIIQSNFSKVLQEAQQQLALLVSRFESGNIVRRGVNVAIVGSPNVGKSTIFNLLTGGENAIVTKLAGTTRDVIRQKVEMDGIVLHLSDTAGLHKTDDIVEKEGIKRTYKEMEQAGIVLAVFDGSRKISQEELALAEACKARPALGIINKCDIEQKIDAELLKGCFTYTVNICANKEETANVLQENMGKILNLNSIDMEGANLANHRQLNAAKNASQALLQALQAFNQGLTFDAASVCVDDAIRWLCALTGQDASEAIISEIFKNFCVGK